MVFWLQNNTKCTASIRNFECSGGRGQSSVVFPLVRMVSRATTQRAQAVCWVLVCIGNLDFPSKIAKCRIGLCTLNRASSLSTKNGGLRISGL